MHPQNLLFLKYSQDFTVSAVQGFESMFEFEEKVLRHKKIHKTIKFCTTHDFLLAMFIECLLDRQVNIQEVSEVLYVAIFH